MTKNQIESAFQVTVTILDRPYNLSLTGDMPNEVEFRQSAAAHLDEKLRRYRDSYPKIKEPERNLLVALELAGEVKALEMQMTEYKQKLSGLAEQIAQVMTIPSVDQTAEES